MRNSKVYLVLLVTVMMSFVSTSAYAIAGTNCYFVPEGGSGYNFAATPIPASFFDPGSDPFTGSVCLFGLSDTIIDRLDTFSLPTCSSSDTVQIEIVQLDLVSCQPITVSGSIPPEWNVAVDLSVVSPTPPSTLTATKTHCNGGTYDAVLYVQPRFIFTRVSNPLDVRVFDTGIETIPPLQLSEVAPGTWQDTSPVGTPPCDGNDFFAAGLTPFVMQSSGGVFVLELLAPQSDGCIVSDNSVGTADLPASCDYMPILGPMYITEGLPIATTIELYPVLTNHANVIRVGASNLGGEVECFNSTLDLQINGTGDLANFNRNINIPVNCKVHTGPRKLGDPVQTFPNEMFKLEGQIFGDPDFDLLKITGGTGFGLPSPGHTSLTQLPSGDFAVDSFFDITYEIEFIGAPGSTLEGMSGTTTGTVTIQQGDAFRDYYSGLPHKAMGLCDMVSDGGGWTICSNIGSSGEDGVEIDLGKADGFAFEVDFGQAGSLGPNSLFSYDSGKDIVYQITETNSGQAALCIDDPPGYDGNLAILSVRISLNGVVVDSNTFTSPLPDSLIVGDIGSNGPDGVMCESGHGIGCADPDIELSAMDSDYPANWPYMTITLPASTTLTLAGSTAVVGDQIHFYLSKPESCDDGDRCEDTDLSVTLRAANTGDIRIRNEKIIKFGATHSALGQAKMYGNGCYRESGWYEASSCGGGLTIYNIGSSGEDGVSIDLPNDIAKEHIYIAYLGDANSTPDGSFIEVTAKGLLNAVPDQNISIIRHEDIGSQVRTSIEYLVPIVPGSLNVEYYLDGQLVAAEPNISPLSRWLGESGPSDFEISWDWTSWELDYGWTYPPAERIMITLLAGGEILVDEVRVSGSTTATFGGYSSMELRAANLPALKITREKTTYKPRCGDANYPYPPGDVDHNCIFDFRDFAEIANYWLQCKGPFGCL